MKKTVLISISMLCFSCITWCQHFRKLGESPSIKPFFHPQGLNYYLHENDSFGNVYFIYYDSVSDGNGPSIETSKIRLQIYNGSSWFFSPEISLYSTNSSVPPRINDIQFYNQKIYIAGSFDSSEFNLGAGVLEYHSNSWHPLENTRLFNNIKEQLNVSELIHFNKGLMMIGNFDSCTQFKCNGMLRINGTEVHRVIDLKTGFNSMNDYSKFSYSVVNKKLYLYIKNNLNNESLKITGKSFTKIAQFEDSNFIQAPIPNQIINQVIGYNNNLAVISSGNLLFSNTLQLFNGSNWQSISLTDTFYSSNFVDWNTVNNQHYFIVQNSTIKKIYLFQYTSNDINKKDSWVFSNNYISINSSKTFDWYLSGNFTTISSNQLIENAQYIAKLNFSPTTIIHGKLFIDINNDEIKQVNEPSLNNCLIFDKNNQFICTSDKNGNYSFYTNINKNFNIKANNDLGYICNKETQISNSIDGKYLIDFPFTENTISDVKLNMWCKTGNLLNLNSTTEYVLQIHNLSSSALNRIIEIQLPNKVSDVVAVSGSANKNKITYNLNLPAHSKFIYPIQCKFNSDSFKMNDTVVVISKINNNDDVNGNNIDTLTQYIANNFKSDIKIAYPNSIVSVDKEIKYTIKFQNNGTKIAKNVVVTDTLQELVNLSKIGTYLNPVNNCTPTFSTSLNKVLIWTFKDINLPPKQLDSNGSKGEVLLIVTMLDNAKIGDTLFNKASVYYDYQLPKLTNTTSVVLLKKPNFIVQHWVHDLKFYPVPVIDNLIIENPKAHIAELKLLSMDGKEVFLGNLDGNAYQTIELNLNKGVYLLMIDNVFAGKLLVD